MKSTLIVLLLMQVIFADVNKWNPYIEYKKDDIVIYNGVQYVSQQSNLLNVSPDNTEYWSKVYNRTSTRQLMTTHEHMAGFLVSLNVIKNIAEQSGVSYSKLQEYADEADQLDLDKNNGLDEKNLTPTQLQTYKSLLMQYKPGSKPITDYAKTLPNMSFYHSAWNDCFVGRKYVNNSRWKSLSEEKRMQYLLHNIGDATVPMSHGVGGTIWPSDVSGTEEVKYELHVARVIDDPSDCPSITPFIGDIHEVINKYKIEQEKTSTWAKNNLPNGDADERDDAAFGNSTIKGAVNNGLSLGYAVLIDYYLSKLDIEASISGSDILENDQTKTYTAIVKDPDAVNFNADGSFVNNGTGIISIEWDLNNNGNFNDYTGNSVDLSQDWLLNNNGNSSTIGIKVRDDEGNVKYTYKRIQVYGNPPMAGFEFVRGGMSEVNYPKVIAGPMDMYAPEFFSISMNAYTGWCTAHNTYCENSYSNVSGGLSFDWYVAGNKIESMNSDHEMINYNDLVNLNIASTENLKIDLIVTDSEGKTDKTSRWIPYLENPILKDYLISSDVFSPSDLFISLFVDAIDPDNDIGTGINAIKWDLDNDLIFDDDKISGSKQIFTYRELLDFGMIPGQNVINIEVIDDDNKFIGENLIRENYFSLHFNMLPPEEGDVNCDGIVDLLDKSIISDKKGLITDLSSWSGMWLNGDINLDGIVDNEDLDIVQDKIKTDITPIINLLLD